MDVEMSRMEEAAAQPSTSRMVNGSNPSSSKTGTAPKAEPAGAATGADGWEKEVPVVSWPYGWHIGNKAYIGDTTSLTSAAVIDFNKMFSGCHEFFHEQGSYGWNKVILNLRSTFIIFGK